MSTDGPVLDVHRYGCNIGTPHLLREEGGRLLSTSGPIVTVSEDRRRVAAAIMAAVSAYLEEEERARLAAAPEARPLAPISRWRAFGRWKAMRPGSAWRRRMV